MRTLLPAIIAGLSVFIALILIWRRMRFGKSLPKTLYPDPDDIVLPPPIPSPPPAAPPVMEPPPRPPLPADALLIADLEEGDTVHVATENSHYRFRLIDKKEERFEVRGGKIRHEKMPAMAVLVCSRRSVHSFTRAFVPGMSLRFYVEYAKGGTWVDTTPLKRVFRSGK